MPNHPQFKEAYIVGELWLLSNCENHYKTWLNQHNILLKIVLKILQDG